ncbi:ABC transporter ATP-binding protein [Aspergillus clavatus NRRL 1]|uniref:Abc transporter n=1 Tax=Aspergillus clavatus (strain ATCC 1007 / CBS 513.65 / DSM 816 / NCTC 3887 / NRRL 1 / QM 1276 / 107) TaxID=344612 RepID=A1CTE3_ASPCL|nr:abc transporter [Aspergillus clavatus NRRL 1]EAW06580.1 abc transporter [Aspergillus clavatus NRRL 1]
MTVPGAAQLLHAVATVVTLLFVFGSFLVNYNPKARPRSSVLRKTVLRGILLPCIAASYIVETIILARQEEGLDQSPDHIFAAFAFALGWATACLRRDIIVTEVSGLALLSLLFGIPGLVLDAIHPEQTASYRSLLVVESARLFLVSGVLINCSLHFLSRRKGLKTGEEEETRPCLDPLGDQSISSQVSYGATPVASRSANDIETSSDEEGSDSDGDGDEDKLDSPTSKLRKSGSWMTYLQNFKVFLPFLIPRKNLKVQACLLVCVLCLIADRVLNILVPRQLGIVADKLFARELPSSDLLIYFSLNILHGQSGLGMIESLAKIPIEQFSYRQLTNAAFNHVMGLAMEFHSDRDSAEVMKAIEQGEALTNLLDVAMLEITPAVLDMAVAYIFLYNKFNSSAALCMLVASLGFTALEVVTSDWNVDNRRRQTKSERAQARVMHQAIQGWQTVSIFNMFSYERYRFGQAVDTRLSASRDWSRRDAFTTGLTEAFFPATFAILAYLVAREVQLGRASPGDFVFLSQYWDYLIWPIKFLSKDYRWLVSQLVDAERLLDLLLTKPTVTDKEGASDLGSVEGRVEFDHVGFSYNGRKATIQDISLSAAPGETIALVGATGAGKTSITKLLLRYYDVDSGSIRIDGRDIRDVTQGSLRDVIGVVPQDPLLFNASIMENLRYAKPSASDEEIYNACRAAAIHDKILTFAKGYHTKVGEQGVKLSGGEVQRLAIARVFLKDPPILVLDEATSAVDTETESEIQGALKRLSSRRTTFVIAHRLSTVVRADQIMVVHDGAIVEKGTHQELLGKRERYYNLWQKQLLGSGEEQEVSLVDL